MRLIKVTGGLGNQMFIYAFYLGQRIFLVGKLSFKRIA